MLVLELSEAEKHFLDKYVAEGKLPTFTKLLQEGKFLKTKVATQNFSKGKAKHLTRWAIWPSIYTGMAPKEHGLIGFGQEQHKLEGRCIWEQLNEKGHTTGVFGSLVSTSVRKNSKCLFYLPNKLTDSQGCFPNTVKAIQSFLHFANRMDKDPINTTVKLGFQAFYRALKDLPFNIAKEVALQIFLKLIKNFQYKQNDILLQAKLQMNVFQLLYKKFKPDFATLHLDHVARAQYLYWRAAEPENFQDKLGELDSYFFSSLDARKTHDVSFKDLILNSFILIDDFLKEMLNNLDGNTLLAIITGLGQEKEDPVNEIHKPDIHFYNIEKLLALLNVANCEILMQMNPEITLKFQNTTEASLSAFKLSNVKILGEYPLFCVDQIENQLFLKENLSSNIWFLGDEAWVENESNEHIFPLFDYVKLGQLKHQYTAKSSEKGWIILYGNLGDLPHKHKTLDITEIFPLLLSYFDDNLLPLEK